MRRVKGPNGLVLTFPDEVAEALLRDGDHAEVKDEPKSDKAPAKKAAAKK